jgi:hypothetical protein
MYNPVVLYDLERMFNLETLIYYSSIIGGIFLALTLVWVAIYNFRISQTKKASLFLLSGLSIGILLIYSILFPQ